ncbi:MAG: metallophosphoesterase [Phycisphaerales bacterium]|nr:metallophosphoesterase [Phycisphaerales bacterium]MCB9855695.1 metallophosphoesterase [Phycisphaerales bacterium]MCB9862590.1 metallophosphoesterase [Phycisphaerales bacterium]
MQQKLRFIGFVALVWFAVHLAIGPHSEFELSNVYGPGMTPVVANRPFSFAVLGDTHAFRGNLTEAVRLATERDCRFLIQLGDFVDYDDALEYRDVINRLHPKGLSIPVYLTRGNHETMATNGGFSDNYAQCVVPTHRTFEYGGAFFCILDNSDGQFAPPQLKECDQRIRTFRIAHPDGPVFLFMHMPPDTPERPCPDMLDSESTRLRLFCQNWRPAAIFAGHVHDHYETKLGDTRVMVSGCGGGSLRAPSTKTHFVEVAIDGTDVHVAMTPFAGESRLLASFRYAVNILAMRYRWRCLAATLLLLIVSILRRRRQKRIDMLRPQPAATRFDATSGDAE